METAEDFVDKGFAAPTSHIDPATIACMLYTSGTTGRPKGVMLSHRAILATIRPTAERTGLGPSDTMLSSLPLFWVAGLVIRALSTLETGCGLLLVSSFTPDAGEPPGTAVDAEGYFMTGDLGRIDGAGSLQFVGRSKDLLRVKGINVSPLEVESVLQGHAGIENVYVVGVPFDGLDQELVALLVVKPQATVKESEVRGLADEMLSHYKRPQRYFFIARDDVPLGGTAKPQRRALAELAAKRVARR